MLKAFGEGEERMEPIVLVLTTAGSEEQAINISEALVERGQAACVNIIKRIRSIYRWKGEIWDDEEFLLVIKTREGCFPKVRETIRELHSYELPEILEFRVTNAEPSFHRWVVEMATGVPDPDSEDLMEAEVGFD